MRRSFSGPDQLLFELDQAVRTLFGKTHATYRANPAEHVDEAEMSDAEQRETARLMRINHTGEVCAQALYRGQALTARNSAVRDSLEQSAAEESDHLNWCEKRLDELGARTSIFNPAFYAGAFGLGAVAGILGDKWSLGFVSETERQVEGHLEEHLSKVPGKDQRTRAILEQMKSDEIEHGQKARNLGGAELPEPIKLAMKLSSKVMTKSTYWV